MDATVGRETCITWVGGAAAAAAGAGGADANGSDPAWAREDWDVPFTVLSTPFPGVGDDETSLVIRHTIEGDHVVSMSAAFNAMEK